MAVYEALTERVQERENSKTKTGNNSVLSSTQILWQELGTMWSSMYFILPHNSPSPIIPQPDHADTQLCDLIMAITSDLQQKHTICSTQKCQSQSKSHDNRKPSDEWIDEICLETQVSHVHFNLHSIPGCPL
jgi:hypothetical protein